MPESWIGTLNAQETRPTILFIFFLLVSVSFSIALYNPLPLLLPIGFLFFLFVIVKPKHLFYLFFLVLPFSVELQFGSLGTDLPSEPLMISLVGVAFLWAITRSKKLNAKIFAHPISLLFLFQLAWMAFTVIYSTEQLVSIKNLLAKVWYIVPFFFLPLFLFKEEKEKRKIFKLVTGGLIFSIIYVLINHASQGFSFEAANTVVRPIFRNHVNYAIMLVAFLPYLWYLIRTSDNKSRFMKTALVLLFIAGIYFSYTRAAQASVLLAIGFYFIIKYRLVKLSIGVASILIVSLVMHLSSGSGYLDYAPDFETTVAHKKFDNLLEATTQMKDVSTVERFYRWIAGAYMLGERPLTGYGPGTFFFQYRPHTVTSYETYVSDNPEKSGIHNNYLMIAVEQGIPGLIIMLVIALLPLLVAEQTYHRLEVLSEKALVMAAAICYFLIDTVLVMNDLLEADKIGPFYYLSAAIIVFFSIKTKSNSLSKAS